MGVRDSDPLAQLSLPPGFRFYPTDEELMVQYLCKKIAGQNFPLKIIGDVDLYKFDPWELPSKAMFGEKEWYFFSPRDRKYPNGSRPNRVAGSGYWKATGTDKVINTDGRKVGIKKALVFYIGKAPKGTKTNWIMHEYRLSESTRKNGSTKLDEWVLCRIYKKNSNGSKPSCDGDPVMEHSYGSSSSCSTQYSDILDKLPEIDDKCFTLPRMNSLSTMHHQETDQKISLSRLNSGIDWAALTGGISTLPELGPPPSQTQFHSSIMNNNVPNQNELFMPNVHQIGQGRVGDEEVQSRVVGTHQRVDNSGGYLFNSNAFTQSFANSIDPFAIGYPL